MSRQYYPLVRQVPGGPLTPMEGYRPPSLVSAVSVVLLGSAEAVGSATGKIYYTREQCIVLRDLDIEDEVEKIDRSQPV